MDFALILAASVAACFALRNPLKACPLAFYLAAIAMDVLYVYGVFFGLPRAVWSPLFVLVQKCELALALFTVVMFIGCLSREGRAYRWLKPVRSELSIVAWFLSLGHMAVYLESYLPRLLGSGAVSGNVVASFALAVVLLVLLVVLGVTSFAFVKKRMRTDTWKRVQKLAYPFFALVYVHLLLMLLLLQYKLHQLQLPLLRSRISVFLIFLLLLVLLFLFFLFLLVFPVIFVHLVFLLLQFH